jgi:hypothetical protein
LVCHTKGITQADGVAVTDAETDTGTSDRENKNLEKTAYN